MRKTNTTAITEQCLEIDHTTAHSKLDMLLIALPWWDMEVPHCGPAVLKGIAESAGYNLKVWDSNADLYHKFCQGDHKKYFELKEYFISDVLYENQQQIELIDSFYDYTIEKIKQINPKFVALSVFSIWTQESTMSVCDLIKKHLPDTKLVVGGRGLTAQCHATIHSRLTTAEKMMSFSDVLVKRKMVDYTILGDGEDALIDLLSGQLDQLDITHHGSKVDLDYPFSNFDDINFSDYVGLVSSIQLPVVSSKGCVRACDFCDVGAQMKRFQSKTGKRLAEEMIYLSKKYKVTKFNFADSIANGNMKELTNACKYLSDYNQQQPEETKIYWAANWISRPVGYHKADFFDLLKSAGCESLVIGAESGSNRVLQAMNKKATVEGLFFDVEQLSRVKINIELNSLNCHWSETFEDFEKHIEMIVKLGPYIANDSIWQINVHQFSLLKNTPANVFEHSGLTSDSAEFTQYWHTEKNPNLTIKARAARVYTVFLLCYRYRALKTYGKAHLIEISLGINEKMIEKVINFYKDKLDFEKYVPCPSINLMDNIDSYLTELYKKIYPTSKLSMCLQASHSNGAPILFVKINNKLIFENSLIEGRNKLEFIFENNYDSKNIIEIGMINKDPNDTQVDEHGNIIKDKNIVFESLFIDNINVLDRTSIFYNKTVYKERNEVLPMAKPGFWLNSSLSLEWTGPFWEWVLINKPLDDIETMFGKETLDEDLLTFYNNIKLLPY